MRQSLSDPEKQNQAAVNQAARCLKTLAHPTRLMILESLRRGERTVTELEEIVGGTQSNMSQHLRLMRDREILSARKVGNQVYYSVSDPRLFEIQDAVRAIFCKV